MSGRVRGYPTPAGSLGVQKWKRETPTGGFDVGSTVSAWSKCTIIYFGIFHDGVLDLMLIFQKLENFWSPGYLYSITHVVVDSHTSW